VRAASLRAAVAALALAGGALAQDEPVEGQPGLASSGGFSSIQFTHTDPQAVLEAWAQPTPEAHIKSVARMKHGQAIYTFVVFRGCQTDAAGHCDLSADFEVFDPAGKPYVQQRGVRTWVDRPPSDPTGYTLGNGYMGLVVEAKDPPGPYRVRMALTDKVAGVTLHSEQTVTVVD
jgi:hypothetical protein